MWDDSVREFDMFYDALEAKLIEFQE